MNLLQLMGLRKNSQYNEVVEECKCLRSELQQSKKQISHLEEELKEYKQRYEQYRLIKDTILELDDEIKELREMNNGYKKIILPLFDSLKHRLVAKSVKLLDKVDYVLYINGALWAYSTIMEYIQGSLTTDTGEKVSLLTRKPQTRVSSKPRARK